MIVNNLVHLLQVVNVSKIIELAHQVSVGVDFIPQ